VINVKQWLMIKEIVTVKKMEEDNNWNIINVGYYIIQSSLIFFLILFLFGGWE